MNFTLMRLILSHPNYVYLQLSVFFCCLSQFTNIFATNEVNVLESSMANLTKLAFVSPDNRILDISDFRTFFSRWPIGFRFSNIYLIPF